MIFPALCAKGPFGTCPRPQGRFNYDKPRLWVILIMGRENYRTLCQRAQSRDLSKASLWAENCPNFFLFFCLGRDKPRLWGRKNYRKGKFFQGKFSQGNLSNRTFLIWRKEWRNVTICGEFTIYKTF
jgi:hypothetical protein